MLLYTFPSFFLIFFLAPYIELETQLTLTPSNLAILGILIAFNSIQPQTAVLGFGQQLLYLAHFVNSL